MPMARPPALRRTPWRKDSSISGFDGSYMVVRELKQDVVAFWQSMRDNAAHIRARDPAGSAHVTTTWLAERVVGRNTKGDLLCPAGYLPPDAYDMPENDFGFYDRDLHGVGCPAGSHVRRSNPRDGLAPTPDQKQTLLDAANNHRILRRGRKYGSTISVPPKEDGVDRGLLFICLNTDIARQFEFVQQTWLLNPNFATLYDETDPLVGPKGKMTIREKPLRRIVDVETFIRMAGGDYFSCRACRPSNIWRCYEHPVFNRSSAAGPQRPQALAHDEGDGGHAVRLQAAPLAETDPAFRQDLCRDPL